MSLFLSAGRIEQWGDRRRVEVLVDATDQPVGPHLNNDADPHRDRSAVSPGRVQHMLLDESAVEELAVEDFVTAFGGGVHEPEDDPQSARLDLLLWLSGLPDQDVLVPESRDGVGVAPFDGREEPLRDVGDG